MRLPSLAERRLVPEEMDDPALPTDHLHGALSGLARLNQISRSARILWRPLAKLARDQHHRPLRILDIATGAGDIPIALYRQARRQGLSFEITGLDISNRTIDFARRRASEQRIPIAFECRDALAASFAASRLFSRSSVVGKGAVYLASPTNTAVSVTGGPAASSNASRTPSRPSRGQFVAEKACGTCFNYSVPSTQYIVLRWANEKPPLTPAP